MKIRFTIGARIGLGFAFLIISTVIVFIFTNNTLRQSKNINDNINNIYSPSVAFLEELKLKTVQSEMLINKWVNVQTASDHRDKIQLNTITILEYPNIKDTLIKLSTRWNEGEDERILLTNIFAEFEVLFQLHDEVKSLLPDFESYNDATNKFSAEFYVDPAGGSITTQTANILDLLAAIIESRVHSTAKITQDQNELFSLLQFLVQYLGIALVFGGLTIAIFTTRSIVIPVNQLKLVLLDLSLGVFPKKTIKERNDEVGEMTNALNRVVHGLKQTKDFAIEVGSGKFDTNYEPLSDQDTLGIALIKMRDELAENERILEEKVRLRTAEVVAQKEEIEEQNDKISELYDQLTDSILYAKRIQEAILPSSSDVGRHFENHFILFRPKDIVSGDFYWFSYKNKKAIMAAADCTGHGVPGALMSMVGSSLLNEIVNEKGITTPSDVLNNLKKGIIKALNQSGEEGTQKDGMDIALISYDKRDNVLEFAGAYNSMYVVRRGEIIEIKADRQPIGIFYGAEDKSFTNNRVQLEPDDTFYLFSDGYQDQFGGTLGKKFKASQMRSLLLSIQDQPIQEHKQILENQIVEWMGEHEQIDDILVIGVRV